MTPPYSVRSQQRDNEPRPRPAWINFPWPVKPVVVGGPWRDAPRSERDPRGHDRFTICMAPEEMAGGPVPAGLVKCKDFGCPDRRVLESVMKRAVRALINGQSLYVGCGWGRGRTGLFLAVLAKIAGEDNPVEFVRRTYLREAVETPAQEQYVKEFPVEDIQRLLRRAIWKRRLTFGLLKV